MTCYRDRSRRYDGELLHCVCDTGDVFCAVRLLDVSETGALLRVACAAAVGDQLVLIPVGPDQDDLPVDLACEVVRDLAAQEPPAGTDEPDAASSGEASVGVRFLFVSQTQRRLLRGFLEDRAAPEKIQFSELSPPPLPDSESASGSEDPCEDDDPADPSLICRPVVALR